MSEFSSTENSSEDEKPLRKLQVAVYELSQQGNLVAEKLGGDLEMMALSDYDENEAKNELLNSLIPNAVSELEDSLPAVDFKEQVASITEKINELI